MPGRDFGEQSVQVGKVLQSVGKKRGGEEIAKKETKKGKRGSRQTRKAGVARRVAVTQENTDLSTEESDDSESESESDRAGEKKGGEEG